MPKLIQWGNSKLGSMLMFNIPASREICGRVCKGCYSYKAYRIYPNVLPAQEIRYNASLQPDFTQRIISEVKRVRKPFKYFRVHASAGEFYDQAYISKWARIAKALPDVVFYAYTKRLKEFDFTELKSLPNFVVIDSFQYGGLNYGSIDKAPKHAFICPDQPGANVQCGLDCVHCMSKQAEIQAPYFKQH